MFMTGSRGGVLITLFSLVLAFALYFYRDLPQRARLVSVALGGRVAAFAILELFGSGINARFDMLGLGDEGRIATWRATMRMIADHPWFGTGQGTFSWAYPAYRQPDISMWGTWDRSA
jgi:O-antigen ligase